MASSKTIALEREQLNVESCSAIYSGFRSTKPYRSSLKILSTLKNCFGFHVLLVYHIPLTPAF